MQRNFAFHFQYFLYFCYLRYTNFLQMLKWISKSLLLKCSNDFYARFLLNFIFPYCLFPWKFITTNLGFFFGLSKFLSLPKFLPLLKHFLCICGTYVSYTLDLAKIVWVLWILSQKSIWDFWINGFWAL